MVNKEKIGLYFGSFNPVHNGHIMIAKYMIEQTKINRIWFIVTPHNPFKNKNNLLKAIDRLRLVNIAIKDFHQIDASDIEFNLSQPSYTHQTLLHLIKIYPEIDFSIIIGADNLIHFNQWKNYNEILENYEIYVYPRQNVSKSFLQNHHKIHYVNAPIHNISSTSIREKLKKGEIPVNDVPKQVLDKIIKMKYFID